MIDGLLGHLETLFLVLFAGGAVAGGALMIVLRQPMRVALALISTMLCLGAIYGLLGVHFIAAFQVLIYVGAVMVFMVYVIMLLDVRDPSYAGRFSRLLVPGIAGAAALLGVLVYAAWPDLAGLARPSGAATFGLREFSATFLNEYWLHFELVSVLLVAAVVAAIAVIKVNRGERG
ncbi:MAG TPA: NADH-quinone oxidoreductase subunit J [Burkholderiales bacterium]|nr:NADH-quinone oxidoreductase subunit J [Burkholderiales bacterium]